MKSFCTKLLKPLNLIIFFILSLTFKADFLLAEESQINSSTKTEVGNSSIPTNPFEIVEMIRRYNSLNDATKPTDAIDDALKSFKSLQENQEI